MRRDLSDASGLPDAPLPVGVTLRAWTPETVPAFFAAHAAFADRPGFPGWSQERWVEWTSDVPDFRADLDVNDNNPTARRLYDRCGSFQRGG